MKPERHRPSNRLTGKATKEFLDSISEASANDLKYSIDNFKLTEIDPDQWNDELAKLDLTVLTYNRKTHQRIFNPYRTQTIKVIRK